MKVPSFERTARAFRTRRERRLSKPPAMVVAPCVGYAESCRRLGYGGGYFDRYLASYGNQRPLAVGVAFDELRVPEEIFESFDEPLDAVVTERRIILKATAPL